MRSLRVHGEGRDKYDCVRIGLNGRLDTIQAAVLIEKLKIFPEEIVARERVARRYSDGLADVAIVPKLARGSTSVWAQYTIRLAAGKRDALAAAVNSQGIPTAVYYPIPLHCQEPYRRLSGGRGRGAGERAAGGRGDQPADARLSRRGDPGPHHRGGATRARSLNTGCQPPDARPESGVHPVNSPAESPASQRTVGSPPAGGRADDHRRAGAANDWTHLHRRRPDAGIAADRLCARHHPGCCARRRADRGCVFCRVEAAKSFPRDLCRGCLQRRLRACLRAHPSAGRRRSRKVVR